MSTDALPSVNVASKIGADAQGSVLQRSFLMGREVSRALRGFVRREPLSSAPLTEITLDLTMACQMACRGCAEEGAMAKVGHASLSTGRLLDLIARLPALGARVVKCYGGEPLLHPDFALVLRALANKGLRVFVSTNGAKLGGFISHLSLLREQVTIRISLNAGTESTHTRIFRPQRPCFHAILRNARDLSACGVDVAFSFVVRPLSVSEIGRAAAHALHAGATAFTIKTYIHPTTKCINVLSPHQEDSVRAGIGFARSLEGPRFRVVVTETLRAALAARSPADLVQPKRFRTCPFTYFRAVVSPPDPGVVVSCPYHRANPAFVVCRDTSRLTRAWLGSRERHDALEAADARTACPFHCDRTAAANDLYALRERYRTEGESVLAELPAGSDDPPVPPGLVPPIPDRSLSVVDLAAAPASGRR